MLENNLFTISEDQNTVTLLADGSAHKFKAAPSDIDQEDFSSCDVCSLCKLCCRIGGRDGWEEFPFKCVDRTDNQSGYFSNAD